MRRSRNDKSKRYKATIWSKGAVKIPLPGLRYGKRKYTIICSLCLDNNEVDGVDSSTYSSSNAKRHFEKAHPDVYAEITKSSSRSEQFTATLKKCGAVKESSKPVLSSEAASASDRMFVRVACKKNLPASLGDDEDFKTLMATMMDATEVG